jgi:hypothetical protein
METKRNPARAWAALLVLSALLLAGCEPFARQTRTPPTDAESPPPPKAQRAPEERPAAESEPADLLVHTVRWKGESLSIIAKWYTGEAKNWRLLAEHNPLKDPDRIGIGDRIAVPVPLLKTREPLPRDFVRRHAPAPVKEGTRDQRDPAGTAPEPSPEEEAPELFGPKELKGE